MSETEQILSAEHIHSIWQKSKPKQALLEHFSHHFKPRTSFEPERVDYNALLILVEF